MRGRFEYREDMESLQTVAREFYRDKRLVLIAYRHPEKIPEGDARRGSTTRGKYQAKKYGETVLYESTYLVRERGVRLYAGDTIRTRDGIRIPFAPIYGGERKVPVECPPGLDMPDPGPRNADKWTGRLIARLLGVKSYESVQSMDWWRLRLRDGLGRLLRFTRSGEGPKKAAKRIFRTLLRLVKDARNERESAVVVYCFNAPAGNDALGVDIGQTPEYMETFFFGLNDKEDGFVLLGRARPFVRVEVRARKRRSKWKKHHRGRNRPR